MTQRKITKRLVLTLLIAGIAILTVTIANIHPATQYRADNLWGNPDDGSYDLAFLELSERGNLFHRERLAQLVEHVENESNALMLVFIHGWQHDARQGDGNVHSFRRMLYNMANSGIIGGKRVLGIYIGWPGRSAPRYVRGVTYWSRKSVAEEIGKGGVSEVLLRLEQAAHVGEREGTGNVVVFVGHSFGGAIMLSALHEILLDKVISAAPATGCRASDRLDQCELPCVQTDSFGHGIVLLNPAIEANQVLQLKESVAERCYPEKQEKLLHVISTEADFTTHKLFPLGQSFRMFGWREEDVLTRNYRGQKVQLSEYDLDRNTVGNFDKFWTGRLQNEGDNKWRYCSFAVNDGLVCPKIGIETPPNLIPTKSHEPLSFVYTDADFMTSHNDVFNARITAYVSALTIESVQQKLPPGVTLPGRKDDPCRTTFDFGRCFESLNQLFEKRF